jgi:tetratricopeptide (TPR) repeat protein
MKSIPNLARRLVVVAGIVAACGAQACMNDYVPNVEAINRSNSLVEHLTQHPVAEPWTARRDRLRKALADGGDFRVKNDLATSLAHTGEAGEAVRLLEEIEAEKPGLYATASNLGTAYELSGDNEKALQWIREGIARNPDSHERSEWLHVMILQAKLAIAQDPKWLESHSVLQWEGRPDPGQPLDPALVANSISGNRGEKLSVEQVKAALTYQLHERLQFVNAPDVIVGALLLDLGDMISAEKSGEGGAYGVFQLASHYLDNAAKNPPLADRAWLGATSARRAQSRPPSNAFEFLSTLHGEQEMVPVVATGLLVGLGIVAIRRRIIGRRLKRV